MTVALRTGSNLSPPFVTSSGHKLATSNEVVLRRLILMMSISLDGFIEGPAKPSNLKYLISRSHGSCREPSIGSLP